MNPFDEAARRALDKFPPALDVKLEPFRAPPSDRWTAPDGVWVTARLLPGVRIGVHFEPIQQSADKGSV